MGVVQIKMDFIENILPASWTTRRKIRQMKVTREQLLAVTEIRNGDENFLRAIKTHLEFPGIANLLTWHRWMISTKNWEFPLVVLIIMAATIFKNTWIRRWCWCWRGFKAKGNKLQSFPFDLSPPVNCPIRSTWTINFCCSVWGLHNYWASKKAHPITSAHVQQQWFISA